MTQAPLPFRIEHDSLGAANVPATVLWGVHTQRALDNFGFSSRRLPLSFIRALLVVKRAAAMTNLELGYLTQDVGRAIISACDALIAQERTTLGAHFPIDGFQGGAGTSTNMNANEVIANMALQQTGKPLGDYGTIHPLHHINLHGSTNDLIPTALRVAAIRCIKEMEKNLAALHTVLEDKAEAFATILKMGRTEMQAAVPMTLGQEFSAFAGAIARDKKRIQQAKEVLRTVNLGGTAIGTGLTAPMDYIQRVTSILSRFSGIDLRASRNPIDATANADTFADVSGAVRTAAVNLGKIAADLRLLHFIGEIRLPAAQVGSSIMPGKINPVMTEAAMQISMAVRANDSIIAECATRGTLQINEFIPMIAWCLLDSIEMTSAFIAKFTHHLSGITADAAKCAEHLDDSPTLVTALLPYIGYDRAAELVKGLKERRDDGDTTTTLRQFLIEKLGEKLVNKALSAENMAHTAADRG